MMKGVVQLTVIGISTWYWLSQSMPILRVVIEHFTCSAYKIVSVMLAVHLYCLWVCTCHAITTSLCNTCDSKRRWFIRLKSSNLLKLQHIQHSKGCVQFIGHKQ